MDGALASLDRSLRAERSSLAAAERAMRDLGRAAVVDQGAILSLSASAQRSRDAIAGMEKGLHDSGKGANDAADASRRLAREQALATSAARAAARADANLAREQTLVSKSMGLTSAEAGVLGGALGYLAGQAASAAASMGRAALSGAEAVAELALASNDAHAGVLASLSLLGETQEEAEGTYQSLNKIASRLGVSGEGVQKTAEALALAGESNKDQLVRSVEAIQEATKLSETAGEKVQNLEESLLGHLRVRPQSLRGLGAAVPEFYANLEAATGKGEAAVKDALKKGTLDSTVAVDALNHAIRSKLGPVADQLGQTFGSSLQRLHDGVGRLFNGVEVGPFERALSRVVDLFDDTTQQGMAMKAILKPVFDTLFHGLTIGVDMAEDAILDLEDDFYKAYATSANFRNVWNTLFDNGTTSRIDDAANAIREADVDLERMYEVLKFIGHVLNTPARVAMTVLQPAKDFEEMARAYSKTEDGHRAGKAGYALGSALSSGVSDGIKLGIPEIVRAAGDAAHAASEAMRRAVDAHSPSRVTMRTGRDMSEGLALGAERARPEVRLGLVARRSADAMRGEGPPSAAVAPPVAFPRLFSSPGGPGAATAHSTSHTVDLSGMRVEINGVEGGEEVAQQLQPMFMDLFERAGLMQGGRPTGSGRTA